MKSIDSESRVYKFSLVQLILGAVFVLGAGGSAAGLYYKMDAADTSMVNAITALGEKLDGRISSLEREQQDSLQKWQEREICYREEIYNPGFKAMPAYNEVVPLSQPMRP